MHVLRFHKAIDYIFTHYDDEFLFSEIKTYKKGLVLYKGINEHSLLVYYGAVDSERDHFIEIVEPYINESSIKSLDEMKIELLTYYIEFLKRENDG